MSDLQIGLLVLGILIVSGVIAFNWWQEQKFRRRAQLGLKGPEADVLLEPSVRPSATEPTRIEPQFDTKLTEEGEDRATRAGEENAGAAANSAIDYIAEIRAGEVISAATISAVAGALGAIERRIRISGYDYHARSWAPVSDADRWYTSLRVSTQLVDSDGPVALSQLKLLGSIIRENAQRIGAIAELPDPDLALHAATDLNEFCSDVDVIVGISVIAQSGQMFQGAKIKALADANEMRLQQSGVFVCSGVDGRPLFTLDNQDSRPFRAGELRQLTTSGITFLLDVPRTPDGLKIFDRMVATSLKFAQALDGMLADDNRAVLNDAGLDKIRNQLRAIYATMEKRGIPAGSDAAQRLFS